MCIRDRNIGYTFDKKLLGENVPLQSLRLFVQGQNLHIWTNFKGDPEAAIGLSESNSASTFIPNSYYAYTYPIQKTYSVGVDINF